jgi:hypothetical protein
MKNSKFSIMVLFLLIIIFSCGGSKQEQSSANDVINNFKKALSKGEYTIAYDIMCPEYKNNIEIDHFTKAIKSCPYLNKIKTFNCTTPRSLENQISDCDCTIESYIDNKIIRIPAKIYVRDIDKDYCIVSVITAGTPVIGLGSVQTNKR